MRKNSRSAIAPACYEKCWDKLHFSGAVAGLLLSAVVSPYARKKIQHFRWLDTQGLGQSTNVHKRYIALPTLYPTDI